MKFNAIVGNPPYQIMDGGNSVSAKPVYHSFVDIAKKLEPDYLSLIMPARWYAGGKGLDEFRRSMLSDNRISNLFDFPNSNDCFANVDIAGGLCYFLWNKNHKGTCNVTNYINNKLSQALRNLNEFDILIRDNNAIPILKKIVALNVSEKNLSDRVSSRKPFNLPTNYKPKNEGVPCWFIQKIGLKFASPKDVIDNQEYINKWKLLVPKSPIAGQTDFTKPVGFYYDGNTRISKPGECCTESYIIAGAFKTEKEVNSFKSYLFTKTVRFLLLQRVVSQDVTRKCFAFIPDLEKYEGTYTDEQLCNLWGITNDEWNYIDSRIKNIN
jgi:site-specific DNA-methyltransferase (adenine-specific)